MKLSKFTAFAALALAVIFWGLNVAIMKLTLESIPPFTLATIRFGIAALIVLPFVAKELKIEKKDIPLMFATGFIGITIHIAAFFYGIRETSALNAGLIIGTTPIFTFLFAHIFLKEKLHKNILLAAFLGTVGIAVISASDIINGSGFHFSFNGDLLIIISMLTFVSYEIISKKLFKKYKPLTVTFYSFLIGTLTFLPFAAFEASQTGITYLTYLPTQAIIGVIYGILISSLAAYSLWEWGLSKVQTARVGFFLYLDPIAAILGAVIILGEKITPTFIFGATLIASGVLLSQVHKKHIHTHRARHK